MKTTANLNLKKPDGTDIVDIADLNGNMDILDTAVKAVQDHAGDTTRHITAAERTAWNAKAMLASPALTGTPTAPTASVGTNNQQLATTAFVKNQKYLNYAPFTTAGTGTAYTISIPDVTAYEDGMIIPITVHVESGVNATLNINGLGAKYITLNDQVTSADVFLFAGDTVMLSYNATSGMFTTPNTRGTLPQTNPVLKGVASSTTPALGDSSSKIATTAFVTNAIFSKANLASPALTGVPTAPTAAVGTNTTQVATAAFVQAAIAALISSAPGALDTLDELAAALGDDPNFATTITNTLALKAPLASPALTGSPTATSPGSSDVSSRIATTAWVNYWVTQLQSADLAKAPLASPALTGTPTAPTAAAGTSTTQLATTAFVTAADNLKLNASAVSAASTANTSPVRNANKKIAEVAAVRHVSSGERPLLTTFDTHAMYLSTSGTGTTSIYTAKVCLRVTAATTVRISLSYGNTNGDFAEEIVPAGSVFQPGVYYFIPVTFRLSHAYSAVIYAQSSVASAAFIATVLTEEGEN